MTSTWTSRKNSLHFLLICAATMISVKDSSSETATPTSLVTTVETTAAFPSQKEPSSTAIESEIKLVSTLHSNLLPLTTKGLTPSPNTTAITETKTTSEVADHAETIVKDTTTSKGVYLEKAMTTVTSTKSLVADYAETIVKDTTTSKGVYLEKAMTTVTSTKSLVADHAETAVKDKTTSKVTHVKSSIAEWVTASNTETILKGVYLEKAMTTVTSTKSLVADHAETTVKDTMTSKADTKFEFDYDYKTLRRNGLIVAAIFFLVGILIIPCARVKRSRPKFSTGRKRSYNLTQP